VIILENTGWQNVTGGRSKQVSGVFERPGLPDVIIIKVNEPYPGENRNPFKVGSVIYLRTRHYNGSGRVFFVDRNSYYVYVRMPYRGEDYTGGVISIDPIFGEHIKYRNITADISPAEEDKKNYLVKFGILALATYFVLKII
jgi:hypothetical protein